MFTIIEPELKMQPTIQLYSGAYFNILNPQDSEFDIETIAWALSHVNRFTGHTRFPYSVAQHSIAVSTIVPRCDAMHGLLHDAAEAFLGDVASPLKQLLPEYKTIEANVEREIFRRFGLADDMPKSVKDADTVMLLTERAQLMPHSTDSAWNWAADYEPLKSLTIIQMTPPDVRGEFLYRYKFIRENY